MCILMGEGLVAAGMQRNASKGEIKRPFGLKKKKVVQSFHARFSTAKNACLSLISTDGSRRLIVRGACGSGEGVC